ncbi:type II toxin-antitoxin system RelE/ParE family toxin [Bizionia sp. M204]|uniref:type II toxin-antitoxin system RelE/ParE family toxin n=1 Tax=Bizionia sp. M204 TaxID=2675331 RepID=UPI00206BB95B|nr:type II toxin-antitoxin system RelE/ParE family toxin [Bizionia sp. M204]UPS92780.1 type II toxin-antitoxin system RelE/ParE family toxin [Bizionia sp. M204]
MIRKVIAYGKHFPEFYKAQEDNVKEKIGYVLDLVRLERQVPKKFFKYLENTDGIYEVRVITTFKSIRILCFFDDGNLVVLANAFVKKTQKTPRKEIKLAEKLKKEYLKEKNN